MNNQEKGDRLEEVVEAIEAFLLSQNPGIKHHDLAIERKKRINVDGVSHEIDLYVRIDMGHGYEATYIFECKNWNKNVGKNEIIVFSKKIEVTGATKGFFIAPGFTSPATAQSKKDTRVNLVHAGETTDVFPYGSVEGSCNFVIESAEVRLYKQRSRTPIRVSKDSHNICSLNGKKIKMKDYLQKISYDFLFSKYCGAPINEPYEIMELPSNPQVPRTMKPGTYSLANWVAFYFPKETRFVVNGVLISDVEMTISHRIEVIPSMPLSQYYVENRGRVGYFKFEKTPGGSLTMRLTGSEGIPVVRVDVKDMHHVNGSEQPLKIHRLYLGEVKS